VEMDVFGKPESLLKLKLFELLKEPEGGCTDKQHSKKTRVKIVPISMWF
jgi:hypothetical protein